MPENTENVVKRRSGIGTLLFLIILIIAGLYAYKKIKIDYNGRYATDRITYTDEFGFCLLMTYHPNYQKGKAKGIAITHIPFKVLFTEQVWAEKNGHDKADSAEMLEQYQLLATYDSNDLAGYLYSLFSDNDVKSVTIGNNGYYFAINAEDIGYY